MSVVLEQRRVRVETPRPHVRVHCDQSDHAAQPPPGGDTVDNCPLMICFLLSAAAFPCLTVYISHTPWHQHSSDSRRQTKYRIDRVDKWVRSTNFCHPRQSSIRSSGINYTIVCFDMTHDCNERCENGKSESWAWFNFISRSSLTPILRSPILCS